MAAMLDMFAGRPMKAPNTIIVGLGKTGLSCARFLRRRGWPVTVMDSRSEPAALDALRHELPEVPTVLGGLDKALLARAELVVVSPGVPLSQPVIAEAIARGVPVVGDIELFADQARAPVVAVTGSNGKSTVTSLVGDMIRQAGCDVRVGGNIGTPALELLQDSEPDFYVLELSSFQLETTHSLAAAVAVVLNISEDHLDRYRDMTDYIQAKRRIYRGDGVMVINLDDPVVSQWCEPVRQWYGFTLAEPENSNQFGLLHIGDEDWLCLGCEPLLPVSALKVAGRHNVANVLAALALGTAARLPMDAMIEAARRFAGLPHRCQWVAGRNGVSWYNDSKATNVGATVAAIGGMTGQVVLIAGGQGKGQDFSPLRPVVAEKCRAVILMGQDASLLAAALGDAAPVRYAANMGEAVACAGEAAEPGDAVLLSPACASFDMFAGFEDRGEQFCAAVERLLQ